jgi:prepilin-type N-terminal cleavage/methylation domain-containing protein
MLAISTKSRDLRRTRPGLRAQRSAGPRSSRGFTLLESAIAIVIFGLTAQRILIGQQLIYSAHVRNLIAQQNSVEAAFSAFQDRFRALPGDYAAASSNLDCGYLPCLTPTALPASNRARPERCTRRSLSGNI